MKKPAFDAGRGGTADTKSSIPHDENLLETHCPCCFEPHIKPPDAGMSSDHNPLDRLSAEELREAFDYYVQRCRNARLQVGQLLNAHAVADGLPSKDDPLEWHAVGPLGDVIDDANSFLPGLEERGITVGVDWLEHVVWLKGQLEDALAEFSADAENN